MCVYTQCSIFEDSSVSGTKILIAKIQEVTHNYATVITLAFDAVQLTIYVIVDKLFFVNYALTDTSTVY